MPRRIILFALLLLSTMGRAQTTGDSTRLETSVDEFADEDWADLLKDLDLFLDSLLMPRSYALVGLSVSPGYFNYKGTGLTRIRTASAVTYSPMLAYYHKSGIGLTATGFVMNDDGRTRFYQASLNPSFDYLANPRFATGLSYTHYFSKDSLPFYVSPLNNELTAYFTWRKSRIRPSVLVNYAWGTREELNTRLAFIERLWLRRRLLNWLQENYEKNISDFSVTASLLHDFYWLRVLAQKDHIRVTPQVLFTAGTQRFGFNQRNAVYSLHSISRANLLSTSREFNLDARREFQALSASFSLKAEYGIGRFFIQPQFLLDYYFPATDQPWSTIFSATAGFTF